MKIRDLLTKLGLVARKPKETWKEVDPETVKVLEESLSLKQRSPGPNRGSSQSRVRLYGSRKEATDGKQR